MDTKVDLTFPAYSGSYFGETIGTTDSVGSKDTVFVAENGTVVLCTTQSDAEKIERSCIYLDIVKKQKVAEKTFIHSKSQKLIREDDEPPF